MGKNIDDFQIKKNRIVNFAFWKNDLTAGLVVYLVALPLCLGIALASGAPLFAGVISGIIAGTIVALLSGSELSVSGPAAGLTVIVAQGIISQGSYEAFLAAVVAAGVIQFGFGLLRAGEISSLFPTSVVKGMLAAIGITIVIKQVPHAMGGLPHFEDELGFWSLLGGHNSFSDFARAFKSVKWAAVFISGISITILLFWDRLKGSKFKFLALVPGPLVVVAAGVVINQLFSFHAEALALRAEDDHLVQLPEIAGLSGLFAEFRHPAFAHFASVKTWTLGFTLALVGSIETLLCIEATDKLDPQHRISDANRELLAQGLGNTVSGLIGGLPMTSVIVRSSANIFAGARTRLAGIFHGFFLLISVLFFATILNLIPLACLAAVLIMVGYKLAHPKLFKEMAGEGRDQFVPFLITIVAIMSTDLLKGVLIGFAAGTLFIVWSSYYSAIQVVSSGKDYLIRFTKDVTFLHRARLKRELISLPRGAKLYIDGTRASYIDHDITSTIEDFKWQAEAKGIQLEITGIEDKSFAKLASRGRNNGNVQEVVTEQSRLDGRKASS